MGAFEIPMVSIPGEWLGPEKIPMVSIPGEWLGPEIVCYSILVPVSHSSLQSFYRMGGQTAPHSRDPAVHSLESRLQLPSYYVRGEKMHWQRDLHELYCSPSFENNYSYTVQVYSSSTSTKYNTWLHLSCPHP
jgi:hypothetical protein